MSKFPKKAWKCFCGLCWCHKKHFIKKTATALCNIYKIAVNFYLYWPEYFANKTEQKSIKLQFLLKQNVATFNVKRSHPLPLPRQLINFICFMKIPFHCYTPACITAAYLQSKAKPMAKSSSSRSEKSHKRKKIS